MEKPETISLYEFFQRFPDEEAARKFFEGKRWAAGISCPHCGGLSISECKDHKPMAYRCRDCRQHFSVRTGTVLAESRLPLHKWLMAIHMMTTARKGIPSTEMARELCITQKSAWFLAQRIRETWLARSGGNDMGPTVEVNETYIGGNESNKHADKKLRQECGSVVKIAVVGIKDRGGYLRAMPGGSVDKLTLQGFIAQNVAEGSTVYTDNFGSYKGLRGYDYVTVNHSVGEYVKEQAHTNSIKSFLSLLKNGYYGIYHYMSAKHLHRYVGEFANRQNTMNLGTIDFVANTAARMVGCQISYKNLVHV